MNKRHYLVAAMCLMTLAACTQKTELPENPKDKEEYRDSQGNRKIYYDMLKRKTQKPTQTKNLSTTHYYYPKSGSWTDANGSRVNPPSGVKVSPSGTSKSKSSGNVFGTTRRSYSIHG